MKKSIKKYGIGAILVGGLGFIGYKWFTKKPGQSLLPGASTAKAMPPTTVNPMLTRARAQVAFGVRRDNKPMSASDMEAFAKTFASRDKALMALAHEKLTAGGFVQTAKLFG